MKWLDDFKVALVSEDVDALEVVLSKPPAKMTLEEMQTAMALIQTAIALILRKQSLLKAELDKVKKAKKYASYTT